MRWEKSGFCKDWSRVKARTVLVRTSTAAQPLPESLAVTGGHNNKTGMQRIDMEDYSFRHS